MSLAAQRPEWTGAATQMAAPSRDEMAIAISEYTGHGDVATCIYALKRHGDDMLAATDWMLRLG